MKAFFKSVGVLLVVAVLVFIVASKIATKRIKDEKRFYYTVSADLTINGERVSLSGTNECQWVQVNNPLLPLLPLVTDTSHHELVGGPAVKRLPDGSALLIWMGSLCYAQRSKLPSVVYSEEPGFTSMAQRTVQGMGRWYIAHFKNAATPQSIDVFIGPQYFTQGDGEISLHRLEVSFTKQGTVSKVENDIPWLGITHPSSSNEDVEDIPFIGYYARVITRSDWESFPELAKRFPLIKQPTGSIYNKLPEPRSQALSLAYDLLYSGGTFYQLKEDGERFSLDLPLPDDPWKVVLRPQPDQKNFDWCNGRISPSGSFLPRHSPRKLSIGDQDRDLSFGTTSTIFDPETGFVINAGRICMKSDQVYADLIGD